MVPALAVIALLASSVVSNGCDHGPGTPLGPVIDPSPGGPTLVVSGTVFFGGDPLENGLGNTTVEVRGLTVQRVSTDNQGRYRAEISNSGPALVWVTASHDREFLQPCATWFQQAEPGDQERTIDVLLTHGKGPFSVGTNPTPDRRTVTGTVVTVSSAGKMPVANAGVSWDSGDERKAWTETNAAGGFGLCGLPVDRSVSIVVHRDGVTARPVIAPGSVDIDIEVALK